MSITLTHTDAEGTWAGGTSKGDGTAPILKAAGFRWSSVGWIIRGSRWHAPRINLEHLAEQLRTAGFEVEVDIDLTPAPAAEKAAAQDEASARRVEGLTAKADRVGAQSDALHDRAREMASHIPFGQPVLVGHHSERRDRRHRARISDTFDKSAHLYTESVDAADRADAAEAHQAHRRDPGTIRRRIDRNEAELRRWQRSMARAHDRTETPDWAAWWDRADAATARLTDQIAYDRQQLSEAEAAGVKLWSKADFERGKRYEVLLSGDRWEIVVRANPKSVTIDRSALFGCRMHHIIDYANLRGVREVTAP